MSTARLRVTTPSTLKVFSLAIATLSLSACLSGGGGGGGSDAPNPLAVQTTEGSVVGISNAGIRVFRGIPYAAPPVGALRFAPPQPPATRDDPLRLSNEFGNSCPQSDLTTGAALGNEDCLYLNVYAPTDAEDLPVMVWIHGGAFVFGNGGGEYDPTRLVEQDVIVVTLNYRLGNLGFLAHPSLESDAGNFALMDQQLAMAWVKDNIAAFGGDPDNVTLFGESAGGHSVMSHIVSPRAEDAGLFQRAIVQSGSYAPFQMPKTTAQAIGVGVASNLGCSDLGTAADCLRALPVSALLAAQGSQAVPVVDPASDLLPKSIQQALADGDFNTSLDVMIGSNQNEGTLFVALDEVGGDPIDDEAEYRDRVAEFFQPYQASIPFNDDQIATDYLAFVNGASKPYEAALSGIWTDFMFACNAYSHANTFAGASMNTFQYWFRDEDAPWTLVPPFAVSFPLGATHAGEIPYVLYPQSIMEQRYSGDLNNLSSLSGEMVDYWTQFAKDGDPSTTDGVAAAWPQAATGNLLILDVPNAASTSTLNFLGYHHCGYWANPPLLIP
ncbi:MAG: carboxylesterase family protein [Pseudomonadaceae bacterium]